MLRGAGVESPAQAAQTVPEQKRNYWHYQYRLGKDYLVPLLRNWGVELQGAWVLDIGCAEGGVLVAFCEAGARCTGLEISQERAKIGRSLLPETCKGEVSFVVGDFHHAPLMLSQRTPDLILLRDVFEHLENKLRVMADLRRLMGRQTRLLITFPPFFSPFGGHQQMLRGPLRKVPYFHALPGPLWRLARAYIRRYDANPGFLAEMEKLRNHRISIGAFEKMLRFYGLRVERAQFYLMRPSHKLRYGWPVISANRLGRVPWLREFLISGAFFLIARGEE